MHRLGERQPTSRTSHRAPGQGAATTRHQAGGSPNSPRGAKTMTTNIRSAHRQQKGQQRPPADTPTQQEERRGPPPPSSQPRGLSATSSGGGDAKREGGVLGVKGQEAMNFSTPYPLATGDLLDLDGTKYRVPRPGVNMTLSSRIFKSFLLILVHSLAPLGGHVIPNHLGCRISQFDSHK